jgi:2'-5' RNA ligase
MNNMELPDLKMTGYRINEYQLVLKPHEELWNRLKKIRGEFAETYDTPLNKNNKPHITVVRFYAFEMNEEKLLQRFNNIAMGFAPFKIELKDFGSFPSHTIFINVLSKLPIKKLSVALKDVQLLMKPDKEHKPHFIEDAFITLGTKLKPWQYEKGWLEYSHRHFTGRFIADHMLLLKRNASTKGAYQVARRFDFQNLPVLTLQGALFA